MSKIQEIAALTDASIYEIREALGKTPFKVGPMTVEEATRALETINWWDKNLCSLAANKLKEAILFEMRSKSFYEARQVLLLYSGKLNWVTEYMLNCLLSMACTHKDIMDVEGLAGGCSLIKVDALNKNSELFLAELDLRRDHTIDGLWEIIRFCKSNHAKCSSDFVIYNLENAAKTRAIKLMLEEIVKAKDIQRIVKITEIFNDLDLPSSGVIRKQLEIRTDKVFTAAINKATTYEEKVEIHQSLLLCTPSDAMYIKIVKKMATGAATIDQIRYVLNNVVRPHRRGHLVTLLEKTEGRAIIKLKKACLAKIATLRAYSESVETYEYLHKGRFPCQSEALVKVNEFCLQEIRSENYEYVLAIYNEYPKGYQAGRNEIIAETTIEIMLDRLILLVPTSTKAEELYHNRRFRKDTENILKLITKVEELYQSEIKVADNREKAEAIYKLTIASDIPQIHGVRELALKNLNRVYLSGINAPEATVESVKEIYRKCQNNNGLKKPAKAALRKIYKIFKVAKEEKD